MVMMKVHPKKNLGQHFLNDKGIAERIALTLSGVGYDSVLEIGPGTGVLTRYLQSRNFNDLRVIEIDNESVEFLHKNFPGLRIMHGDFLALDLEKEFPGSFAIIGNFPYNISSQIFFRILEYRDKVPEVSGMLQREVAQRICASPGSKTYGILSVLLQAFYSAEYLFTVSENVFYPPPKVKSGVIRLRRNNVVNLSCDERLFFSVVKAAFNQRRKTLRNSIRSAFRLTREDNRFFGLRAEQLSVNEFVELTGWISRFTISE